MKRILVFNTGSTSIRYKLFNNPHADVLELEKKGKVEYIGSPYGPKNHKLALEILFRGVGFRAGNLYKIPDLAAIGHRVVYGGNKLNKTCVIDKTVIEEIKKYNVLAPLHNPPVTEVMEAILAVSGSAQHRDVKNYAVFDAAYFSELPLQEKIYPLPYHLYEKDGIQRFGFHGISHQYVNEKMTEIFRVDNLRIISLHLGGGASCCATLSGKPIAISMGYTPLDGLMMTTRSGEIDPGILIYLIREKKIKVDELDNLISYDSGIKGIAEFSSDMRDILYAAGYQVEDQNYRASKNIEHMPEIYKTKANLALSMYVWRIKKYIGAYYALLGGLDALVFTGKIGAGSSIIRKSVLSGMEHIIKSARVEVVSTDEETQIAKEILGVIN